MYKYVIFDVDGTMIDTEEAVMYAYQQVIFNKYGRYFTEEELLKGYGVPTPQTLANYGFTDIEAAMKDYYKYLIEGFKRCSVFDGIIEVISHLKDKNIPIGIVTSRCKYEIDIDSSLQSLVDKFESIVCSDDTINHKPNPDPLIRAMEKMNAIASETIYIGDTIFDSMCANSAGVKFALALWGTNNANNISADYYLKKPAELLELL
ncbi:HAD family hydrolase [Ruminiclostridium herbifermentans]|uniref:HAD family hydrolase n=1 Tax=Ruminiclostridium herbifermentans TaxID=2488810 RepID=A0A4U7JCN9_9FIRM|nr:HAD family hydrolase [Ruminiclostridium herbifermentans]QNU67736.1 HAD family hydrolase [Ruminiclostridium herbifermentans]